MYLNIAALVQHFDFQFEDVKATDFEMVSDQFIIGTKTRSVLKAHVTAIAI
jgi:hypothetical protein